jgi:hypothetical protein
MNEFEKSYKKDVTASSKRRSFLKKTASGAVIVSLPAKSVWGAGGCSPSGMMSGNMSHSDHPCAMPIFSNGRSPGNWQNYEENLHDTFLSLNALKHSVGFKSGAYADGAECYIAAIEDAMSDIMIVPAELNGMNMTVAQGLQSNGSSVSNNIYFHLAAVYLNAYFEFYDGYSGRDDALAAVEQVFLYWYQSSQPSASGAFITDNDLGYHNGQTSWTPKSNSCPQSSF